MTNFFRSVSILALALVVTNCSKGKSPAAAADSAVSASSVNVLNTYDANNITQIQFEKNYGAMQGPSQPNTITSKILVLQVSNQSITNKGVFLQDASNRTCTGSVGAIQSVDLFNGLAQAYLGVRPADGNLGADGGYDRLSLFFKDGSSIAVPFNSVFVAYNQTVIFEGSSKPLDTLLANVFATGTCTPN